MLQSYTSSLVRSLYFCHSTQLCHFLYKGPMPPFNPPTPHQLSKPDSALTAANPLPRLGVFAFLAAMSPVVVFLMAVALTSAGTIEAMGDIVGMAIMANEDFTAGAPRRSRFLAARDPKGRKCDIDPSVCLSAENPGSTCCNAQCVDTDTDVFNCGKCGKVCKFTQSCCGGKCVDLAFNKRHCGKCFNRCQKRCFYGLCDYA